MTIQNISLPRPNPYYLDNLLENYQDTSTITQTKKILKKLFSKRKLPQYANYFFQTNLSLNKTERNNLKALLGINNGDDALIILPSYYPSGFILQIKKFTQFPLTIDLSTISPKSYEIAYLIDVYAKQSYGSYERGINLAMKFVCINQGEKDYFTKLGYRCFLLDQKNPDSNK